MAKVSDAWYVGPSTYRLGDQTRINTMPKLTKKQKKFQRIQLEWVIGLRPPNYIGPLPRPTCRCNGTGCWGCMNEFVPNVKAHWMSYHTNPCAEIALPVYDKTAITKLLLDGEVGVIEQFRMITR